MKRLQFTGLLFCTALLFFLASCGGNKSKEQTNTDSTAVENNTNAVVPAPNTIITTPVTMMSVTHKVADYEKFQASYDAHDSLRLANGLHSYVIARGVDDPNTVMVVVKVDDIEKARAFSKDAGLKNAMKEAGVTGAPTITFSTSTWQDTATLPPGTIRSRTTFTVKDWDAWVKSFMEGKQERLNNGITDRVVGHDADDNKKVSLVTAVLDTAKAFAYYKSDALKKRREAGGVIGEPKRFLFTVVKRY
ncbi:MAG: hypothetical protein EPN92_09815 [Chitinophagaceae bacterium]|nr:MAG: hypothetical protein EPN92_09815 [Chitinophagaceae bacterium]